MSIMRMNPFGSLIDLQDRLNRLIDDAGTTMVRRGEEELGLGGWRPAVDVFENENEYIIKAELPEVRREDVKVHLENNRLTISGSRHLENEDRRENYHRIERAYGSFSRSFTLPSDVLAEEIQANYRDGLLKVTLPKSETAKPRQIQVGGEEGTRGQSNRSQGKSVKVENTTKKR